MGLDPMVWGVAAGCFVAGVISGYLLKRAPPPPAAPLPTPPLEHRLERFGLLWFVQLTLKEPHITKVLVGLPHCKKCVVPLKLQAGAPETWLCLDCGARHEGTAADTQVMDAVRQQAVEEYCQRHKGWRLKT